MAGGRGGLWPALAEHPSQPLGLALMLALLCGPGVISWLHALELSVIAPSPSSPLSSPAGVWLLRKSWFLSGKSFWWHLSHSS